jgi:hypothetical protein
MLFLDVKFIVKSPLILLASALLSLCCLNSHAQTDDWNDGDSIPSKPQKGFHAGLFIGAFWANGQTAYLYDGYGFDQYGQRNSFNNSILYNQIVNVYGNGNNDLIAQLLNVSHTDWQFTESNMPFNLRYTTTYLVGLNTRYQLDKKQNIMININGTKLSVNGKFSITSNKNNTGFQTPGATSNQNQFTIVGAEQRLMFQFGYQRILGKNEKVNVLVEGGFNIIMSKAQKNQALLYSDQYNGANNIAIDLMSIYNQPPYNYYSAKYLIGVGIGAFGGIGFNFNINPRYSVQLLYTPSYDRISLGYTPEFKMQHGCGLRIYYNFSNL